MTDDVLEYSPPWTLDRTNHPAIKERVKAVAQTIFGQIVGGQYSFGTRLASERDLAREFRLSRAAVRQVIGFLENYDVVKRRPNSGTFVTYSPQDAPQGGAGVDSHVEHLLNISSIAETASPFEMNILCSILEPEMVRISALYMSVRDLEKLRKVLDEIQKIVTDAKLFAHLEKEFLMTIAEGTHNRLLTTVYSIVTEVRRQPHWCATRIKSLTPERIRETQNRLKSLYFALENRDIESAVEFMKLIIGGAQDEMLTSR